jgi:hypothetical protein
MSLLILLVQAGLVGLLTGMIYPVAEEPVMFFLWVIPNAFLVVAFGVAKAAEKE